MSSSCRPLDRLRHRHILSALALMALLGSAQAQTPPAAKSVPGTDQYPGFQVTDPYRNLENLDDADTQAWMKAQADHARAVLDTLPHRAEIRAAIDQLDSVQAWRLGDIKRSAGGRLFYTRRDANTSMPRLFVRNEGEREGRLLLDPARFDTPGKTHALSWHWPSPSGRRIAVGVAASGSEEADLYVMDVDSGAFIEGPLPRSWLGIVWWVDEEQLLLQRMRVPGADEPAQAAWIDSQVLLHRIGRPISEDVLVFGTDLPRPPAGLTAQDFGSVVMQPGEPWLVAFGGGVGPTFSAWALPASELGKPDPQWRAVFDRDALNSSSSDYRPHDGQLHAISTQTANGEIVRYDLASGQRHVLRPAGSMPIEQLGVARDGLYFRERQGVYTALKRIGFDGRGEVAVAFPRNGNPKPVADFGPYTDPRLDGALVSLDAWTAPSHHYLARVDGGSVDLHLDAPLQGVDLSSLHVRDLSATSHDGTRVPLTVVYSGELKAAAQQPTLVTGYGAYGISSDPFFHPFIHGLTDAGMVLAMCHVRGGGEFGNAWHEAGRMANKANTWKDMIACAEALHAQGISVPAQTVGMGTSAGGTTIINAVAERPDLFVGAINNVGVSDMLRMLAASANGPNHYAEFGDIRTAEGAAVARAMSGYERIAPRPDWPTWLVIHGVNDPRVDVWQSNKFVARMQAASPRPVLYRLDYASGHGIGSTADTAKNVFSDIGAFVLAVTGGKL